MVRLAGSWTLAVMCIGLGRGLGTGPLVPWTWFGLGLGPGLGLSWAEHGLQCVFANFHRSAGCSSYAFGPSGPRKSILFHVEDDLLTSIILTAYMTRAERQPPLCPPVPSAIPSTLKPADLLAKKLSKSVHRPIEGNFGLLRVVPLFISPIQGT